MKPPMDSTVPADHVQSHPSSGEGVAGCASGETGGEDELKNLFVRLPARRPPAARARTAVCCMRCTSRPRPSSAMSMVTALFSKRPDIRTVPCSGLPSSRRTCGGSTPWSHAFRTRWASASVTASLSARSISVRSPSVRRRIALPARCATSRTSRDMRMKTGWSGVRRRRVVSCSSSWMSWPLRDTRSQIHAGERGRFGLPGDHVLQNREFAHHAGEPIEPFLADADQWLWVVAEAPLQAQRLRHGGRRCGAGLNELVAQRGVAAQADRGLHLFARYGALRDEEIAHPRRMGGHCGAVVRDVETCAQGVEAVRRRHRVPGPGGRRGWRESA